MARLVLLLILVLILAVGSAQADEFILPPIIKESSPADSLAEDPIVPSRSAKTGLSSGSGSVSQNLEDDLPYSVTDPGRPGGLSQFRGLGDRAEDTNVQTLGIPLNYPQGGGFDFSSFPQFFWSDYRFALTPSLAALDPSASSGTMLLTPWTAQAISSVEPAPGRWSALYAGEDLQQFSVGAKYQDRVALLAGYSFSLAQGPTGAASVKVYESDRLDVRFHLLATSIDSTLYNFSSGVSPTQTTNRVIPVAQANWTPKPDVLIKSSVFYDNTFIRYDDISNNYSTRDRAQQVGIENATFWGDWKFGMGARRVYYGGSAFYAPTENVANLLLVRTLSLDESGGGRFLIDPSIQGVYVTNFGMDPQASLGLRQEWLDGAAAVFFRWSYSRRFPSLADRYYSVPGFGSIPGILGNPSLSAETDLTYIAGVEGKSGIWSGSLQGYYQIRDNAEVITAVQGGANLEQLNLGQARIASLTATGSAQVMPSARLRDTLAWTHSRVDMISSPFPYVPNLVNISGVDFEPLARLTLTANLRTQTSEYVSSTAGSLQGVAFVDVQASYEFRSGIQMIGRAENVTGDPLVLSQGYPPKGRVLTISLIGPI